MHKFQRTQTMGEVKEHMATCLLLNSPLSGYHQGYGLSPGWCLLTWVPREIKYSHENPPADTTVIALNPRITTPQFNSLSYNRISTHRTPLLQIYGFERSIFNKNGVFLPN